MKSTAVKFTVFLFIALTSLSMLTACNHENSIEQRAKLAIWRFKRADPSAFVRDCLYKSGPEGWMIEFYEYSTWISTYVFCPDGDCNLTENSQEYVGMWHMHADTIRILFYEEIKSEGIGKPMPLPQEHGFDYMQEFEAYLEETNCSILFKRNLSWQYILESITGVNERPYKLISREATCH